MGIKIIFVIFIGSFLLFFPNCWFLAPEFFHSHVNSLILWSNMKHFISSNCYVLLQSDLMLGLSYRCSGYSEHLGWNCTIIFLSCRFFSLFFSMLRIFLSFSCVLSWLLHLHPEAFLIYQLFPILTLVQVNLLKMPMTSPHPTEQPFSSPYTSQFVLK